MIVLNSSKKFVFPSGFVLEKGETVIENPNDAKAFPADAKKMVDCLVKRGVVVVGRPVPKLSLSDALSAEEATAGDLSAKDVTAEAADEAKAAAPDAATPIEGATSRSKSKSRH